MKHVFQLKSFVRGYVSAVYAISLWHQFGLPEMQWDRFIVSTLSVLCLLCYLDR